MAAPHPRFQPLRPSARATLWSAGAAAASAFVTALTLDGGAASLTLTALGAFVACALYAILGMSRYAVAAVAAVGAAIAIGAGLAFLRLIGLAWDQDPDAVSTISSRDADPFFLGAMLAAAGTLAVLFVGAVWPQPRRRARASRMAQRRPSLRRPSAAPRRPQSASAAPRSAQRAAAGATARRPVVSAPQRAVQRSR
ncbi:hypothetical protein [Sinomonas mesophila]|uniref:hypothetical protein n=1 Tax=Sinomonas mesophila TaxID=1531955 RepID=UPI000985085B|nr:hypothetical protein [Sinomonas mesophila]